MSNPTHSRSLWDQLRDKIIIPALPYYYVAVALIAFWINPRMFAFALVLALAILVSIICLNALLDHRSPPDVDIKGPADLEAHLDRELTKLAHEERCPECKGRRMKQDVLRDMARMLHEKRMVRDPDRYMPEREETQGARPQGRGQGKKKSGRRR